MTEEQQRKIDNVARLVAAARRRANHDDKVALTILAAELHDATATADENLEWALRERRRIFGTVPYDHEVDGL